MITTTEVSLEDKFTQHVSVLSSLNDAAEEAEQEVLGLALNLDHDVCLEDFLPKPAAACAATGNRGLVTDAKRTVGRLNVSRDDRLHKNFAGVGNMMTYLQSFSGLKMALEDGRFHTGIASPAEFYRPTRSKEERDMFMDFLQAAWEYTNVCRLYSQAGYALSAAGAACHTAGHYDLNGWYVHVDTSRRSAIGRVTKVRAASILLEEDPLSDVTLIGERMSRYPKTTNRVDNQLRVVSDLFFNPSVRERAAAKESSWTVSKTTITPILPPGLTRQHWKLVRRLLSLSSQPDVMAEAHALYKPYKDWAESGGEAALKQQTEIDGVADLVKWFDPTTAISASYNQSHQWAVAVEEVLKGHPEIQVEVNDKFHAVLSKSVDRLTEDQEKLLAAIPSGPSSLTEALHPVVEARLGQPIGRTILF